MEELPTGWRALTTPAQIGGVAELSREQAVVIFKHSTRCGISHMAKYQLERDWPFEESELTLFVVDVIRHRPVSDEVSQAFGIIHQSPQVLLLLDAEVRYHTSHHMISADALQKALNAAS